MNDWLRIDSDNHTKELTKLLQSIFQRLATLNCKTLLNIGLSKQERMEIKVLRELHTDIRQGHGPWKIYK